ncbi:topoisomerase IA [Buttiauxella gaviniae ATCC 51604]|uniref:Topoisomerase IA n=1 Tax=Buttiauxella gaviniae ATCC 51604 TaxID=1354253 RepID=A0A1B7I4L0_9ENTR|nr:topoisomerase IA [Buttiauxella gaviniae ATCC 51604]
MTWPTVDVNQLNQLQGETNEIERVMLFVGSLKATGGTATAAVLSGGVLATGDKTITKFTAVTDGAFKLTINGTLKNVSGLDLSAVTTLAEVATAVSAKLSTLATVTWNDSDSRFVVTTLNTGAAATLTVATAGSSGTDLSVLLKLTAAAGAVVVPGHAGASVPNAGKVLPVNTQTDFDVLLGAGNSVLKTDLQAAMRNAGQNWFAYVWVMDGSSPSGTFADAVKAAQAVCSVEGVVLCDEIAAKDDITLAGTLIADVLAKYQRWIHVYLSVQGVQKTEAWADYLARVTAYQDGIADAGVTLIPRLFGAEPGVYVGRLCNRAVTIADSPARVKTGPVVGLNSTGNKPVDKDGNELGLDTLQALSKARFSVPMWYPDYDGYYWSDGITLDAEGGDYQAIENKRVVDKVCRRVRLLAIAKIADRSLNSTPTSMASHQQYFAGPMREMSRTMRIQGVTFPGEVMPPQDGDVQILWRSKTQVEIYIIVRTYECPKGIKASVMLDLSLQGGNA